MAKQVSYTYNFRAILPLALEKQIETSEIPADDLRAMFDAVEKDGKTEFRRKPLTVVLTLPDFADNLPALAQDVIRDYVADYVKGMFVNQYLPVGDHDWATIEAYIAQRGGSGRRAQFDISDELLLEAAGSIGDYMATVLGNASAGEKFKAAVLGKYTRSAIMRNIGEFNPVIVGKLQARLDAWLEHVATNDEDRADDMGAVYEMLAHKLQAHLKEGDVAVASLL